MSDVAIRYHVHNKPPKGAELTDAAKKNFTAHSFSRSTGMTGCGKEVPQGDVRWKIDRDSSQKLNCARCLSPKAAPGEHKAKAKVKKAGKGKKAPKKASQPLAAGTAVPKGKMAELKARAKKKQAAGSSGSPAPAPEPVEPEYDPLPPEPEYVEPVPTPTDPLGIE